MQVSFKDISIMPGAVAACFCQTVSSRHVVLTVLAIPVLVVPVLVIALVVIAVLVVALHSQKRDRPRAQPNV
jgi:hypothetical protein